MIHSRSMVHKRIEHQLEEDFRRTDRVPAEYASPLEGMELSGVAFRDLLREISRSERPVLSLYLPGGNEGNAGHEFALSTLRRRTMVLADRAPTEEVLSFLQGHSWVRFGLEHRDAVCFFETRVLGSMGEGGSILLAERPERIFLERRKIRRYRMRPEHEAFLGWMPVRDISWRGLRMVSETSFEPGERLECAHLSLPRVRDPDSGADLSPGGKIRIPRAVVKFKLNRDARSHYGVCFEREWEEEQAQKLVAFLRVLQQNVANFPEGPHPVQEEVSTKW